MADGGALHWALHRSRSTSSADIHVTQAELIAHFFRVFVLNLINGMAAPADNCVYAIVPFKRFSVA